MAYVNATFALTAFFAAASCGGEPAGALSGVGGSHSADADVATPSSLERPVDHPAVALAPPGPVDRLPAPQITDLPGNTWRLAVTVRGMTRPSTQVVVGGEISTGVGMADADGRFAVGVELRPQSLNRLRISSVDEGGIESAPRVVTIDQDAQTVRTKLPIVLHHGYMGFRELVGVPYWYDVVEHLEALGFDVRTTQVPPLATVEERAAALVQTIRRISSGRIHLVGHSMGGLDSRYAVSLGGAAKQVATLTTIGTPHRGSPVADLVLGGRDELAAEWLLERLGIPAGGLVDLTVAKTVGEFNPQVLDVSGVQYFSWSSVSDPFGLQTGAPLNPLFAIPYAIVEREEGDNDGLVSVSSAQWGVYLGNLAADHLDQVGHLLGLTDDFDHLQFWQGEAERLEEAGL